MSKLQYWLTLSVLAFNLLVNFPYAFHNHFLFKDFVLENQFSLDVLAIISSIFYWIAMLLHFRAKQLPVSIISGIIFGISNITLIVFFGFNLFILNETFFTLSGYITILYTASGFLYGFSFLLTRRTKHFRFLRLSALILIISMGHYSYTMFYPNDRFHIAGLLWLAESILLIFHIIYERNREPFFSKKVKGVLDSE